MIRHIPNTLTLLNLVSGFAATIYAIKGYNEYATFCIMVGMILDFSDGFAARLLKAYSDIGKDLDSLADVVTFGVAPGAGNRFHPQQFGRQAFYPKRAG